MMALSCPFKEDHPVLPLSTPLSSRQSISLWVTFVYRLGVFVHGNSSNIFVCLFCIVRKLWRGSNGWGTRPMNCGRRGRLCSSPLRRPLVRYGQRTLKTLWFDPSDLHSCNTFQQLLVSQMYLSYEWFVRGILGHTHAKMQPLTRKVMLFLLPCRCVWPHGAWEPFHESSWSHMHCIIKLVSKGHMYTSGCKLATAETNLPKVLLEEHFTPGAVLSTACTQKSTGTIFTSF